MADTKTELHLHNLADAKSDDDIIDMLTSLYTKLTGKTPSASEVAEALDHYKSEKAKAQ